VIDVTQGPVSRPYIDMTVDIMRLFGIALHQDGYTHFEIPGAQTYQAGDHAVEPDGSQAGYFWAAAAITGTRVKVRGVTPASRQGDVGLADIFGQMGCRVTHEPDGTAVTGGTLSAVDVDMGNMPDMVPTLAVVAAFAGGTTIIRNVAHLRAKESDRLAAVSNELARMGIKTHCGAGRTAYRRRRPQGRRDPNLQRSPHCHEFRRRRPQGTGHGHHRRNLCEKIVSQLLGGIRGALPMTASIAGVRATPWGEASS
jgi:3-phosphoshikimate 1-carboxyvinyltransferase